MYVRYALRTLGKNLGLTLTIAASLAIGIGANSAIFSVVNALLLRPLPYPDPGRLAAVWLSSRESSGWQKNRAPPDPRPLGAARWPRGY